MDGSRVNLWYLSPNTYGGWVTFTAHLYHGLRDAGFDPLIRKIGKPNRKTETKTRSFGYDAEYQNTSEFDVENYLSDLNIICAKNQRRDNGVCYELMHAGAPIVVHDPTELKDEDLLCSIAAANAKVVVIRKQNLNLFKRFKRPAVFIRHPYKMAYGHGRDILRSHPCITTCRIDSDKKMKIILEANRHLDEKILVHGFENRVHTKWALQPAFPEWEQSKSAYPRELRFATDLCRDTVFMADMSAIKGDGGGTQYTFLEAWDAGAVVIINRAWVAGLPEEFCDMIPGVNCLAVSDAEELVDLLELFEPGYDPDHPLLLQKLRAAGWKACRKHNATEVAKQFIEVARG